MLGSLAPILGLALLPTAVFLGGVALMQTVSGRHEVVGQKPLNSRVGGYDVAAVAVYWGALSPVGRAAERRFLQFDLAFPIAYGAALAASLLIAARLGGAARVPAAWLVAPVVVTVLADWVENLVQLEQLGRYVENGAAGLGSAFVRVASAATIVKLLFFSLASLALLVLLAGLARKAWTAPAP